MKTRLAMTLLLHFSAYLLIAQSNSYDRVRISRNDLIMNGMIFPLDGEGPFPALLLLHGFPGGESDVLGIGIALQEAGIVTLTFNYSGTYGSDGKYSMEYTPQDIGAAFDFLQSKDNVRRYKIDTTNISLGGYSYGGGMALSYAAKHSNIRTIISIAGTDHGEFFREYFRNDVFANMIDQMFEQLRAPDGPVRFEVGKMPKETTPEDVARIDSAIDLRKISPLLADRKILLIAGIDDPMVTMESHMLPLYRALQREGSQSVKFVVFQDDHSFRKSRGRIAETILHWIRN